MDYKNYAAFTGVVSNVGYNADTSIQRPVVQISVYNKETREWSTQVYVVFHSSTLIKNAKKIREGDILSVFGSIDTVDKKLAIRCENFLRLSKAEDGMNEFMRRPELFQFDVTPNVVIFFGEVVNSRPSFAYLSSKEKNVINGEVMKPAAVSVYCDASNLKNGDRVAFIGSFNKDRLEGQAMPIAEEVK